LSHVDSDHEDSSVGFLMFFSESRKWQKRNLSGQNRTSTLARLVTLTTARQP
jgi:hypothetical protein